MLIYQPNKRQLLLISNQKTNLLIHPLALVPKAQMVILFNLLVIEKVYFMIFIDSNAL